MGLFDFVKGIGKKNTAPAEPQAAPTTPAEPSAQEIANKLGKPVRAPSTLIWFIEYNMFTATLRGGPTVWARMLATSGYTRPACRRPLLKELLVR